MDVTRSQGPLNQLPLDIVPVIARLVGPTDSVSEYRGIELAFRDEDRTIRFDSHYSFYQDWAVFQHFVEAYQRELAEEGFTLVVARSDAFMQLEQLHAMRQMDNIVPQAPIVGVN